MMCHAGHPPCSTLTGVVKTNEPWRDIGRTGLCAFLHWSCLCPNDHRSYNTERIFQKRICYIQTIQNPIRGRLQLAALCWSLLVEKQQSRVCKTERASAWPTLFSILSPKDVVWNSRGRSHHHLHRCNDSTICYGIDQKKSRSAEKPSVDTSKAQVEWSGRVIDGKYSLAMTSDSTLSGDVFISYPVGKGQYICLTKAQFQQISACIDQDKWLVDALVDFRARWTEASEIDDPNAEPVEIVGLNKVRDIVETVTNDEESRELAVTVVIEYLKLPIARSANK